MISCAFLWLHLDVCLSHPPTVQWNVHICFRWPGSGWASNAPHFRRVSRSKAFPKQEGDLPEQVIKWFLWGGHCMRGAQMVCVLSHEPPTLTPPVSLQHSLSGHLDGVCELFESEACLCEHLLFQPNSLFKFLRLFFRWNISVFCRFMQKSHCFNLCGGVDALLNLWGVISQANEIEDVYT